MREHKDASTPAWAELAGDDEETPETSMPGPHGRSTGLLARHRERVELRENAARAKRKQRMIVALVLGGLLPLVGYLRIDRRPTIPDALGLVAADGERWLSAPLEVVAPAGTDTEKLLLPLRAAGFRIELVSIEEFRSYARRATSSVDGAPVKRALAEHIWWVTNSAARAIPKQEIVDVYAKGDALLLDGWSPAAQEILDFVLLPKLASGAMTGKDEVWWHRAFPVFQPRAAVEVDGKTVDGDAALVRRGRLVWSLASLEDGPGTERFPHLPQTIQRAFDLQPIVASHEIDLYVDPDLEDGASHSELAERWHRAGVRRVFVSAWKDNRISDYHFDYDGFTTAMHERDIEVFAWLEWPHINFSFWKMYPECRDRTADSQDARIFWREHVAIMDPKCFDLAWKDTKRVLDMAAFDGVNLAELYFEPAGEGPHMPSQYTPMNDWVRRDFRKRNGFDPQELFWENSPRFWANDMVSWTRWTTYREDLVTQLHDKILGLLAKHPAGKKLMITAIDDRSPLLLQTPAPTQRPLRENLGSNTHKLAELRKKYDFEFQVEDPFTVWMLSQERYETYTEDYADIPVDRLVLDINVVHRDLAKNVGRSTSRAVGQELYRNVASVGRSGARLALYASATIDPRDLRWVRYALAGGSAEVKVDEGGVIKTKSNRPFFLRLQRPVQAAIIDGKESTFAAVRELPVPAGSHTVELR